MNLVKILVVAAIVGLMASCTTTRENNLSYFKNAPATVQGTMPGNVDYGIKLETDDEISIVVSSMAPEATAMFNAPLSNSAQRGEMETRSNSRLTTYVVDSEGCVTMPVIGKLNVKGKTVREVEQMVKQSVSHVVKDPFVTVRMMGYYVNVVGEVKTPGRVKVPGERFTLLDALAACGDLTEYADRGAVMVIREENGQKNFYRINMADTSLFASPCYYLQQNDVVYVEPNTIKIDNSKYNTNNAFKLSVISTVVSAASVIASLVIALTVK
ncbi:MAG: polysaccharide biosynthesis/export family protein [Muribaculaceae bacterium]|nr:polysaccharide biosynthesis/export family protein [Muribaculaceae bacterium]